MMIADAHERFRALNPQQSFIVQAPAGSGKTELLTQRFLVLLSIVSEPEEILAITFTKKSAAEMRARIINALQKATSKLAPTGEHEKKTWELAHAVLNRNNQLKWNLLENPNRLQIQTIDSFNASLTRHLPLLSNMGGPIDIIDNPHFLYREAVNELLAHLEYQVDWSIHIETLLLHLDNDLSKLETLLINMLAKRDQWLPYLYCSDQNTLRAHLEEQLSSIISDTLLSLRNHFPKEYERELIILARFAAQNVSRTHPQSLITHCLNLNSLPGTHPDDKIIWLGLAELLLTKSFEWRKRITEAEGFPAGSKLKNSEEKNILMTLKQRMLTLLEKLSGYNDLNYGLMELSSLPDHRYTEDQWKTLDALQWVLKIAVAQLRLIFQKEAKVDYTENAQAALMALGPDESPTDLALALDYKIQHILVDEFQDTSNTQYRLLEKLTLGWETEDGRTLFVVGDPMQSIYRFREAEVGLFIRARNHGIGHLKLTPLTLSVNFRSEPDIINWVNDHFDSIFPKFDDIASGAVSYSKSTTAKTSHSTELVHLHAFFETESYSEELVECIKQLKNEKCYRVAILVRSRSHLNSLIPALKKAKLNFRAIDIDPLITRPVIQDLLSLARALLHPADRVAWLSILRAPWCALTLNDLLSIAGDKTKTILWEQMQSESLISQLSLEGQQRLIRFRDILRPKLFDRERSSLSLLVESTWFQLGGPACLTEESDLEDANSFFKLLQRMDSKNSLLNIDELNEEVEKLFSAPDNQADSSLQIMTIHSAKGLEFDAVILPQLERHPPPNKNELMLWMQRPLQEDKTALLLAPIHAVGNDKDPIYSYIKNQNMLKNDYETIRLLYVAATRAKKELHLFFNCEVRENQPKSPSQCLLHKLWPTIKNNVLEQFANSKKPIQSIIQAENAIRQIKRLSLNWSSPLNKINDEKMSFHHKSSGFQIPSLTSQITGTLIHHILQQLSLNGITWWSEKNSEVYIKNHLRQLGLVAHSIEECVGIVKRAIHNTLHDPKGQWILYPHEDSKCELPLTLKMYDSVKQLVVDRTFIDTLGIRWIIDYKSTDFKGDNLSNFLNFEQKQHEKQLYDYYLAFQEIEKRPIKMGLYFPLIPAWHEWSIG